MPAVPSSKEPANLATICPHAANLQNHSNGEGSLPLKGMDKISRTKDAEEDTEGAVQINRKSSSPERKWIRPDLPSRCTWTLGASKSESPHSQIPRLVECQVLVKLQD